MQSQSLLSLAACLLTALAVPLNAGAQETSAQQPPLHPARYTVTDLGTLPSVPRSVAGPWDQRTA